MTLKRLSIALAAALAAASLFLIVPSSVSAFAADEDDDEIEYTYDEDLDKWLYPICEKLSVSNYLLSYSAYICFDVCPGGDCPQKAPRYFDQYPTGVLVDWPDCINTNINGSGGGGYFYCPEIYTLKYAYGYYGNGTKRYEYLLGDVSSLIRQEYIYGESLDDPIFFEIATRAEFAGAGVYVTFRDCYTAGSYVSGDLYKGEGGASCSCVVDLTAPEIECEGEYINETAITVTDEVAGIEAVFVKGPSDADFSVAAECDGASSVEVFIPAGSENGTYEFFAADMCGNSSEVFSVRYDSVAPILTLKETEESFVLTATDETGSACKILDADGNVYGDELLVSKDFVGTKTFWAVDEAGNVSDPLEVSIVLRYPEGALYATDDEAYYFTWDDPGGIAMLDDEPYEKDTVVTAEGKHLLEYQTSEGEVFSYEFEVGHYYYETYRVDATCRAEGYVRYDCAHCDDFYTETLERLEHSFYSYEASATCEEGGYIRYTCMYCGESYTFETSSATGHVYLPASSTATCTSPGGTTYTCIFCGDSYVVGDGVLADHDYVVTEVFSASCEEPGYRILECCNCGDERVDMINPLEHEYYLSSEVKDGDGNVVRTYTCTRCGESYSQTLGDTQNSTAKAIVDIFERYQKYIWWILLAVAGVWSLFMGIRYALASRDEEREKAKRTIVNYLIGLLVIAVILVAAPYLVYGIALLLS